VRVVAMAGFWNKPHPSIRFSTSFRSYSGCSGDFAKAGSCSFTGPYGKSTTTQVPKNEPGSPTSWLVYPSFAGPSSSLSARFSPSRRRSGDLAEHKATAKLSSSLSAEVFPLGGGQETWPNTSPRLTAFGFDAGGLFWHLEAIAHAAYRAHIDWRTGILLYFLPYPAHVHVQGPGVP
jgi:hypothetical protein